MIGRKFKCKDHDTLYEIESLDDGYYTISWHKSDGEIDSAENSVRSVENAFNMGGWYFVDGKEEAQPIKSDGGSSSYYELTITNKAGESIKCETGDVIRALVGNDFDFGNCVKALRRMYLASLGMGKEGTNIPYDCNKIRYFISEIERVNR